MLVVEPFRINCVLASPISLDRDPVVACEFGDRLFTDADHRPDFAEAAAFGLVEIKKPLRCEN